ncbi:DUF1772 domain-containing protein [Chitinophaga sp. MM2321]|uniref:DUF1772 domain-containing protein n=1 Tax=Chitinophaga sp. MM2321 TaxID=3137178 RepID=UPI0032D5A60C
MITVIIRFFDILMAGLIAGTLFGIWIGFDPKSLSAPTYVEQQQSVIKALNVLMPILGLITILLTITAAFLQSRHQAVFVTLLVAAGFLMISGLVTRFGNQPINSIVMTWDKMNVPANWTELRDKWWLLHKIRALTAFISFCLIIWSGMRKD